MLESIIITIIVLLLGILRLVLVQPFLQLNYLLAL